MISSVHTLKPASVLGPNAVLIATNHSAFEDLLPRLAGHSLIVDPWNVTGSGQVFAYADELVST